MHQTMYLKALVLYLLTSITAAQPSSVIFPIHGNVYPDGLYTVTIRIGQPPQSYALDIDTGSDLTWLQCDYGTTRKYFQGTKHLYKPNTENLVTCQNPICKHIQGQSRFCDPPPNDKCNYVVKYADNGFSMGVAVKDSVSLNMTNGTTVAPQLAFGCGYYQDQSPGRSLLIDGVLGLGKGGSSILTQLSSMGVIRNFVGHCLSAQGGGFLFFGEFPLLATWKSILTRSNYNLGSADLLFVDGKNYATLKNIVFDSGSTYTYFSSEAYGALLSLIKHDLEEKIQLIPVLDRSLPECWEGAHPFKSINDAINYFEPMALRFTDGEKVQFQLPPESYLIVTEEKNVCLGILNGTEVGLGDLNVIGDISMQDKLVIYDNERGQVGWVAANCSSLPKY